MSKEAYFSHDSNARNDGKIIALRMKHGMEGYGIYFGILERLRENSDYTSTTNYDIIAFDLRVDSKKVRSIVEDFGLFVISEDGSYFYSESFTNRMKPLEEKREKCRMAGKESGKSRSKGNAKVSSSETVNVENESIDKQEPTINPTRVEQTLNTCSANEKQTLNENEQSKVEVVEEVKESKEKKEKCSVVEKTQTENFDDDTTRLFKNFKIFNESLAKFAPKVLRMEEPLTFEQYQLLLPFANGQTQSAKNQWMFDIFKEINNKPDLFARYSSAYTTYQIFERQKKKKLANT